MCIKNVSSICVIHIYSNCELIENWIEQVNNFSQDFYNGNILYKPVERELKYRTSSFQQDKALKSLSFYEKCKMGKITNRMLKLKTKPEQKKSWNRKKSKKGRTIRALNAGINKIALWAPGAWSFDPCWTPQINYSFVCCFCFTVTVSHSYRKYIQNKFICS